MSEHIGEKDAPVVRLTDAERIKISAVVHLNYYMPDVFAVVEQIIAERGEEHTEWNILRPSGLTHGSHGTTEESARISVAKSSPGGELVSRRRITFPDITTEWTRVTPPGEGHA